MVRSIVVSSMAAMACLPAHAFDISSAHHYELNGPYKFQTEYSNMQGFNSPNVVGTANPDGLFVFFPPRPPLAGGVIQITFPAINADLAFTCLVGNTGRQFELVVSEGAPGHRLVRFNRSSGPSPKGPAFSFNTGAMAGTSSLVVRITSDTSTDVWNLAKCEVTPP